MLKAPVFMVGPVRSGSTLLRLMVGSHPEIAANPEFGMAVDLMDEHGSYPPLNTYYDWLERDRIANLPNYRFEVDPDLDYPQLVDSFLCQRRDREGKRIVTATVHHHFDRILKIWPDARFVYTLRDGRDVAKSVMGMGWAGNTWTGTKRWMEADRIWSTLRSQLPRSRWMEIRYEDLITDSERELTRLCTFYGVEFDDHMFDYAKTSSYGLPDPGLTSQWRTKQTKKEVQLAEAAIGDLLLKRGYELSGFERITVTHFLERRLNLQDWWFRARFRIKNYGLILFSADYVARRLGSRALQDRLQRRIDQIVNSSLRH